MAFLFRSKAKSDITKSTKELLLKLWDDNPLMDNLHDDVAKALKQIRVAIQGTQEADPSPEEVARLVESLIDEDLLYLLAKSMPRMPFMPRKDAQGILSCAIRFKPVGLGATALPPVIAHMVNERPETINQLCRGYESRETAMQCGMVLREALRHRDVAAVILYDQSTNGQNVIRANRIDVNVHQNGLGIFWQFFEYIEKGAFEVSADAFNTFREILISHVKSLTTHYLMTNFDLFFHKYNTVLVQSESYVTKRQSIKLLGEILLDRANYAVMIAYVDKGDHLKLFMNLLRDYRKMVQYESFHVFKVFVANPRKSLEVQKILMANRVKLLNFLPTFLDDRNEEDTQFHDEKHYLIKHIGEMTVSKPTQPAVDPAEASPSCDAAQDQQDPQKSEEPQDLIQL